MDVVNVIKHLQRHLDCNSIVNTTRATTRISVPYVERGLRRLGILKNMLGPMKGEVLHAIIVESIQMSEKLEVSHISTHRHL